MNMLSNGSRTIRVDKGNNTYLFPLQWQPNRNFYSLLASIAHPDLIDKLLMIKSSTFRIFIIIILTIHYTPEEGSTT